MAEMMNEGQKNMLEWLRSGEATPEEIRKYMPYMRMFAIDTEQIAGFDNLTPEDQAECRKLIEAEKELKSIALEMLSSTAAKDSGLNTHDNSLLTKLLIQKEDTGLVTLGKKDGIEKQGRAQISGKLTLIEYNILRSILSYQLDNGTERGGEITITASQIYRKMRRGAGSGKVNKTQQESIHKSMLGLERRIQIWLNDPASEWLGITEERRKNMRILHFDYDEGIINGQRCEYYYTIYNVGLLQEIAYRAGQLERIPQEILAIEEKKGEIWKPWTLSEKRIELRTVLELFLYQLLRSNTTISNKKPYEDIFSAVTSIKTRADIIRAKKDIAIILNYWQRLGMIAKWSEYGSGRGIEIHLHGGAE